jgi:hypothetical protein
MNRRGFLGAILAAGFAPAAIGSGVLMPARPLWRPWLVWVTADGHISLEHVEFVHLDGWTTGPQTLVVPPFHEGYAEPGRFRLVPRRNAPLPWAATKTTRT